MLPISTSLLRQGTLGAVALSSRFSWASAKWSLLPACLAARSFARQVLVLECLLTASPE